MSKNRQKVKLAESDWEALFPGSEYALGKTKFMLYPLSLSSLALIARRISDVTDKISDLKLSPDDFTGAAGESSTLVQFVKLLLDEVPEVLAEMSGLDTEDAKELPLGEAVKLFNACLDVNINSQQSLVKNLQELGDKFRTFTQGTEAPMTARTPPTH